MKHLKKFENFQIHETMDIMTLPFDLDKAQRNFFNDLKDQFLKGLQDKIDDFITNKFMPKFRNIKQYITGMEKLMEKYLKSTTSPNGSKLGNFEIARILAEEVKKDMPDFTPKVQEIFGFHKNRDAKESNILLEIIGFVTNFLGWTMWCSVFSMLLPFVLSYFLPLTLGTSLIVTGVLWVIFYIGCIIMEKHGYDWEGPNKNYV